MSHSHQKKSTHFACDEIIKKYGDNAWCCACNNRDCKKEVEVECTCHDHDEIEIEVVEMTGKEALDFLSEFMGENRCGCGLHTEHSGKHAPDEPKKENTCGCPFCTEILPKIKKSEKEPELIQGDLTPFGNTLKNLGEWLVTGNTGSSSIAMMAMYLGADLPRYQHPVDMSDFDRCVRFLSLISVEEGQVLLEKLAKKSRYWHSIRENWHTLLSLYGKHDDHALYHFMKTELEL